MHIRKETDKIIIILESGEEMLSSLELITNQEKIASGFFYGIGGIKNVTLGYYDLAKKEYINKNFDGNWELVSLNGSVARNDNNNQPLVHAHASIASPDYALYGGHLLEATITITAEIILNFNEKEMLRYHNPKFNLSLIEF